MLRAGQKVFYKESDKIFKNETTYLGVVRKLKSTPKFVVIDVSGYVIGTIRQGIRAIELTIFAGIRLPVEIKR